MAVEQRHYTPTEQQAARGYFDGLASQPHPTHSGSTFREVVLIDLKRQASVGTMEGAKEQLQSRLRRDIHTNPLDVSHAEEAAMILESGLPMDEAIILFEDRLVRELRRERDLLPLAVFAPDPDGMRIFVERKIEAGERRLSDFREALTERTTEEI